MDTIPIRLMQDRRYKQLPVDQIVVLNARDREEDKFKENVQSIKDVGLLKPVLVNERFYESEGKYELVCGQGRLIAHQRLGKQHIAAEVIDCDRKHAYLLSLIENIARVPADTMWFAREIKRMRDAGMSLTEIGRIVGKSESSVAAYVTLVEKGEERLIRGVESGMFPITFATKVAESDEAQVQNLLMDAFDNGVVSSRNVRRVQKIIRERISRHAVGRKSVPASSPEKEVKYTVDELKRNIANTCRERESFVREASAKERRLVCLVEGMKALRSNGEFMDLLKAEELADVPHLKGRYNL